MGGAGSLASGVCGCLLLPVFAKRMRLRPLYLPAGVVGSLFTAGLLALHHSVATYTLAVLGENAFQSLAITCSITYMLVVDGWGYGRAGVTGAFATDAGVGVAARIAMGRMLTAVNRRRAKREAAELTV